MASKRDGQRPLSGIRICRKRARITQGDLAARLGTSRQQIQRLENGERNLTLDWARRIAEVLNCNVNDIFQPDYVSVFGVDNAVVTLKNMVLDRLLRGYKAAKLELILVETDDVAQTARSGDYILLDKATTKVSSPGLFLISTWAEAGVWRYLAPLPTLGKLRVSGDAANIVEAEASVADITIIGRARVRITAI